MKGFLVRVVGESEGAVKGVRGRLGRRGRESGAAATEGDVEGGEIGGDGTGSGGGDDGGLGLLEEPPDGLAVGLMTELARELEDARGADDRHANAAAAAVDLAVAVLGRRFLDGEGGGGWLLVVVDNCVVVGVVGGGDGVSGSVRVGHVLLYGVAA